MSRPKQAWLAALIFASTLPAHAQTAISADGVVESKSGGFKFPDGTVQSTAAGLGDPCPTLDPADEMIWVGGVCIDMYEASIWDAPVGGNQIIGTSPADYCSSNGQDCDDIYARSVAGVEPAAAITWFQAQQALANSGKRLPTNAEWQMAVAGTPDPGATPSGEDCNTNSAGPENTGDRENCVSRWGAHDMVGNVAEWVADWDERSAGCAGLLSDRVCIGRGDGDPTLRDPGGFVRGGAWFNSADAGPFAIDVAAQPSGSSGGTGFRGAR